MKETIPSKRRIGLVARRIRSDDLVMLVHLADLVNRWVDRGFDNPDLGVGRLSQAALNHLILHQGSLKPTELARLMHRTRHSITKVIDHLEMEGLVKRQADAADRRVTNVRITAAGLEQVKRATSQAVAAGDTLMSCMNVGEKHAFMATVRKLRRQITASLLAKETDSDAN